jgi:hypothetical protein
MGARDLVQIDTSELGSGPRVPVRCLEGLQPTRRKVGVTANCRCFESCWRASLQEVCVGLRIQPKNSGNHHLVVAPVAFVYEPIP